MKKIKFILSLVIILSSMFLGQQIISLSIANQKNKNDYAEINHVKYGLFSVDKWKQKISVILIDEINKLDLSDDNAKELKVHIETQLNTLIDKIDANIREGNKGSVEGWVKQKFINIFLNLKEIKKGIPSYADAIIKEMSKKKTKVQIKALLNEKLVEYVDETFDTQDTTKLNLIMKRLKTTEMEKAKIILNNDIANIQNLISDDALILIALSIILFLLPGFSKAPLIPSQYIFLVLSLIILLVVGVSTPMIDMEAKISQMSFVLLDHEVTFKNQVLYFQSKSILDVFRIMITNKAIQMKLVGVLVVSFSIFFPITKIISSLVYYFDFHKAREKKLVNFFVFKSGKWSMADVLVVAIFMAYIGFNGIISSQFEGLNTAESEVQILTTNGTNLQPGYYLFLTYTLLALFLSAYLARTPEKGD